MKYAKPLIGSAVLIGLMLAVSAWALPQLGDRPVAVHFGIDGRPNGYAPPLTAVLAMPITAVILAAVLTVAPRLMPRNSRLERSWGPYVTVWLSLLALLAAIHLGLIGVGLGWAVSIPRLMVIGSGLLFAVIGNLLGKVRYNYIFGVRTPWTLADERVWDRTHRFAGRVMMISGLAAVFLGLTVPAGLEERLHLVTLVVVLVPALASVAYSFVESRRIERGPA